MSGVLSDFWAGFDLSCLLLLFLFVFILDSPPHPPVIKTPNIVQKNPESHEGEVGREKGKSGGGGGG